MPEYQTGVQWEQVALEPPGHGSSLLPIPRDALKHALRSRTPFPGSAQPWSKTSGAPSCWLLLSDLE